MMRCFKSVRYRLMLFVVLLSLTAIASVSAGGLFISNRQLNDQLEKRAKDNLKAFLSIIRLREREALGNARNFATRKDVTQAVEFADFDLLRSVTVPLLEQSNMEYLVLTNSDGRTLFRAHRPDDIPQKDDNIAKQENIRRALSGEESVGIEEGAVVRLSLRAGAPIRNATGDIIGALSTGYVIDSNSIVDETRNMTGGIFSVFSGKTRISSSATEDGADEAKRPTEPLSQELYGPETPASAPSAARTAEDPELGDAFFSVFAPLVGAKGTVVGAVESSVSYGGVTAVRRSVLRFIVATGGLLLALFMLVSWFFLNFFTRPLLDLRGLMTRAGTGDLSAYADVQSDNELSELMATFNQMTQRQSVTVAQVRESAEQVRRSSEEIANATMEATASTEESASHVASVSALMRTGERAAEKANDELLKLAGALASSREKGREAIRGSDHTLETAGKGRDVMAEAIRAMGKAKTLSDETEGWMRTLDENSRRISSITDTITSIARQTNLLALNAAIEAARAGEAGKGFAVVADEVRKLAEESNKGASEVSELVARIVENTAGAMNGIRESRSEVENGFGTVERAGQALKAIVEATNATGSVVKEIVGMTDEAAQNAEVVVKLVADMLESLEQTAEKASEVSAMTEETSGSVADISARTQELSAMADQLTQKVSAFRVAERTANVSDQEKLKRAKSDHLLWKVRISNMLKGLETVHTEEVNQPHECRLGTWYFAPDNPWKEDPDFKSMDSPHCAVHDMARNAAQAQADGDLTRAKRCFAKLEKASATVIKKLNRLLKKMEKQHRSSK